MDSISSFGAGLRFNEMLLNPNPTSLPMTDPKELDHPERPAPTETTARHTVYIYVTSRFDLIQVV